MFKTKKISKKMSSEQFLANYYLKEELIDFCRREKLSRQGSKQELTERIAFYLRTGKQLLEEPKPKKQVHKKIDENTIIGENVTCSQNVRAFFEDALGKSFKFNVHFMQWLHENPNKTFGDAVEAYKEIKALKIKTKTTISKECRYNQYVRDFFKENPDRTLKEAIKCWNYKKQIPGEHRYEPSDLKILK